MQHWKSDYFIFSPTILYGKVVIVRVTLQQKMSNLVAEVNEIQKARMKCFFFPLVCLLTFKHRNAVLMEDGADNFEVCAFALSVFPLLTS